MSPFFKKRRATIYTLFAALSAAIFAGCGAAPPYVPPEPSALEREWMEYHELQRDGRPAQAAEGFALMCRRADDPYPRACHNLSSALEDAGDFEGAAAAAAEYLRRFPGGPHGSASARLIARVYSRDLDDPRRGREVLASLARELEGTDAWDSVMYAAAGCARDAGDAEGERADLDPIARGDRWDSQLWNDAVWRLVELAASRGDREEEKRLLARFLKARERSFLIARYYYPKHDDALLRLGRIYLEEGDEERALGLFMELGGWETSRMRDDGLLWAAKVEAGRGKPARACELLRKVLAIKDANKRKEASAMGAKLGCGTPGEDQ